MADSTLINSLVEKAFAYQLDGAEMLESLGTERLKEIYNGIGPAWLPENFRKRIESLYPEVAPAALIHDCDYEIASGKRDDFYAANRRLLVNIRRTADCLYTPVLSLKWWRMRAIAKVFSDLCNDFGWVAYRAASAGSSE